MERWIATYGVIVQNKSVLVLVEIVKRALRDTILDFNAALDVLLVRKLHLVIDNGRLIPLTLSLAFSHSSWVLHAARNVVFDCSLLVDLLIEGHWVVVLALHIKRRVASLHEPFVGICALVNCVLVLRVHQRHVF